MGKIVKQEEIFIENSKYSASCVKYWGITNGELLNHCYSCGTEPLWRGKGLVLHMDHKNGITTDNRIDNLQLLCPNCHSQTKNYAGRNRTKPSIGSQKYQTQKRYKYRHHIEYSQLFGNIGGRDSIEDKPRKPSKRFDVFA